MKPSTGFLVEVIKILLTSAENVGEHASIIRSELYYPGKKNIWQRKWV